MMTESKGLLDLYKNLRMVPTIKVSGMLRPIQRMVVVSRFGLMVLGMMASGKMEWPMVGADLFMLRVMYMRASGLKIRLMAKEFTLISMVHVMKAFGIKISNMASV